VAANICRASKISAARWQQRPGRRRADDFLRFKRRRNLRSAIRDMHWPSSSGEKQWRTARQREIGRRKTIRRHLAGTGKLPDRDTVMEGLGRKQLFFRPAWHETRVPPLTLPKVLHNEFRGNLTQEAAAAFETRYHDIAITASG
jgi:hypothetical protein